MTIALPDVLLSEVLSFLPKYSHLPICHVSKQFRNAWSGLREFCHQVELHRRALITGCCEDNAEEECNDTQPCQDHFYKTNPLLTLFGPKLHKNLLKYYLENCGLADHPASLKSILIRAAQIGDTDAMTYLIEEKVCPKDDVAICTAAAEAGQLDALIYAREVFGCPWNARKAYEAANKRRRDSIMTYIYLNSDDIAHSAGMPV
eukprot:CAMPEP_0181073244 /NCGR_PEP_ID=MMETSP1070-20121207/28981_1 /TAXON_ID=265543 /ORGANISM="Minutocellus polymorphus, Strain NH13" /LENGTH=203 /DNA_ID=CAMNT_0023154313 /DNA_START=200 /DNA_END=811 /DNA_ORIENTATION=+